MTLRAGYAMNLQTLIPRLDTDSRAGRPGTQAGNPGLGNPVSAAQAVA